MHQALSAGNWSPVLPRSRFSEGQHSMLLKFSYIVSWQIAVNPLKKKKKNQVFSFLLIEVCLCACRMLKALFLAGQSAAAHVPSCTPISKDSADEFAAASAQHFLYSVLCISLTSKQGLKVKQRCVPQGKAQ